MKLLLLLVVVLVGVWLWRSSRAHGPRSQGKAEPKQPLATPLDMVQCAHCGVHLPQSESHQGKFGRYCSADHLALAEH